jgi:uncharacterized damage-inducible protein DinB
VLRAANIKKDFKPEIINRGICNSKHHGNAERRAKERGANLFRSFALRSPLSSLICVKQNAMSTIRTQAYLKELNAEHTATRNCLERIPETLYDYKPHPKSMTMGYLTLLVAEIPLWIKHMIVDSEIDFVTFKHASPKTTAELIAHYDDNIKAAREALNGTNDEDLQSDFSLKANGQLLYSSPKIVDIGTTLNHWVHHRGQLTVFMRLNDIPVPSIYGPSADEKNFSPPK